MYFTTTLSSQILCTILFIYLVSHTHIASIILVISENILHQSTYNQQLSEVTIIVRLVFVVVYVGGLILAVFVIC